MERIAKMVFVLLTCSLAEVDDVKSMRSDDIIVHSAENASLRCVRCADRKAGFFSQSQIGSGERAAVLAESHESQNTINGSRSCAAMAAVD